MTSFYSKSKIDDTIIAGKSDWKRVMSAFYPCEIEYEGFTFTSIETAFHWAKYQRTDHPEHAMVYPKGGPFDNEPAKGKRFSSKTTMKRLGCTLDVKLWDRESVQVMKELISIRWSCDSTFREVIEQAPKPLLHFERGKYPKYGCYKSKKTGEWLGHNLYGKMLERQLEMSS